ncbi:MAG: glycosyltransferase family 2 protein [Saprospiraceae bacterium]|nr:glycosyltransferase family 2 protein [Saprospiraceae bacterium]
MHKISIIIPTYNEEKNLSELLPLLTWADEIIVIDSYSTDKTQEIAQQYKVRFIQHEYISPAKQKNWIIPQASNKWIFLLDADERPTPSLINEIKKLLNNSVLDKDAYWIYRKNYFLGQQVNYSGWQNDKVIRFFRKDICKYDDKHVHEEIITEGSIGILKGKLEHYTCQSLAHFSDKMDRYAYWSAKDYYAKTTRVSYFHLGIKPLFRFLNHFLFKLGFLDGKVGFIISKYMAWGVFLRYAKLKEMHVKEKEKDKY